MPIGWAVVGIGRHPDRWMAPAIAQANDSRLLAVLSRDQDRADAFARKHGAERGYTSLAELLKHPGLDAVYIASPNFLHAEQTIHAARAGKHVLCEKPMALTVDECRAMVEECRRQGVRLGVGYHLRHHPGVQKARSLIRQGTLGKLVEVQGQWAQGQRAQETVPQRTGLQAWWMEPQRAGAGTIMAQGVHVIDLIRYLSSQEITEVVALSDNPSTDQPLEWFLHMLFRLQNGTAASAVCSRLIPDSRNDAVAYGSLGRLVGAGMLGTAFGGTLEVASESVNETHTYGEGNMYVSQVEAFNRSIREGTEPSASGTDGLQVCRATEAALRSAREGRAIHLEALQV